MHAFSGCDTVSSLSSVGKKTAWEVWKSLAEITEVFQRLSAIPDEVTEADLKELERYVVLLYSRTSHLTDVNEARKHLFSYCNRNLENIPPSRAALLKHVKRAAYQAGYVWGQTLEVNVSDLALGTTVTIPTFHGPTTLDIPAGTKPAR